MAQPTSFAKTANLHTTTLFKPKPQRNLNKDVGSHQNDDHDEAHLHEMLIVTAAPRSDTSEGPPTKKLRRTITPGELSPDWNALHRICNTKQVSLQEVEAVLHRDPKAARRSSVITSTKTVYDARTGRLLSKICRERYTYPLNLAIQNEATTSIIEALIDAAPRVLATTDGHMKESSLHVLVRHKPMDVSSIGMMLLRNPKLAYMNDGHSNTPLHAACSSGASEDVVRYLCIINPNALHQRNFHGHLPIQLAQRTYQCSDKVATYLLDTMSANAPGVSDQLDAP